MDYRKFIFYRDTTHFSRCNRIVWRHSLIHFKASRAAEEAARARAPDLAPRAGTDAAVRGAAALAAASARRDEVGISAAPRHSLGKAYYCTQSLGCENSIYVKVCKSEQIHSFYSHIFP